MGDKATVTVKLLSNAPGRPYLVVIHDKDLNDTLIGKKDVVIEEAETIVNIEVTAPEVEGFKETHTWSAEISGIDYYAPNNYYTFNVSIYNIPWWVWLLAILLVVIFVFAILKSILATVRDMSKPKFRYFKRMDEEEETSSRFMMSSEKAGTEKFRFFRKL